MRIVRGSLPDIERDRDVTRRLGDIVDETGEPALRAWTPPKQIAFGRRDAAADGYERAREEARERGYEHIKRSVGGHAVAYTGGTVAFTYAIPTDSDWGGIQTRYEDVTGLLQQALRSIGVSVQRGEPEKSFCPGEHSLQGDGKIAGLAQRVRRMNALVGGCIVVTERDEHEIAAVLGPVYTALGVPFDPESVGSVESASGPSDPARVIDGIETTFVGDRERTDVSASDLLA
ncbi:MAG: octanoyl-[GcvH]:protein N-octanoyltransferase [Natronomonas sp.]|jgi:octanoyl-[GcvH]:protein N-octanoyltransferase|uniref:lipoyl protein ligase domain-containing protein n=1 Tax=Natronomonas sp. TaxID=2184060 RepID=UPI003989CBEE